MWETWGQFGGSIVTKKDESGKEYQSCWIKFSELDNGKLLNLSKSIWMNEDRTQALCDNKPEAILEQIKKCYKEGMDFSIDVAKHIETGEVLRVQKGEHKGEIIYQFKKCEHMCDAGTLSR